MEAAGAGTGRINQKMAEAVALAKIAGTAEVDKALGVAAVHHRFAHGDLASLLQAAGHRTGLKAATEESSLTQGTAGWASLCFVKLMSAVSALGILPRWRGFLPFERWAIS